MRDHLAKLARWLHIGSGQQQTQDERSEERVASWTQRRASLFCDAENLLRRAARDSRQLTVVAMDLHDLAELKDVFGARVALEASARTHAGLRKMSGRSGFAFRADLTCWVGILPGVNGQQALALAAAEFGKPYRVEIDLPGEELVLLPEMALRELIDRSSTFMSVYDSLRGEILDRRTRDHIRQGPLRRNSRAQAAKLASPPLAPTQTHSDDSYPRIPPTVPLPLEVRRRMIP